MRGSWRGTWGCDARLRSRSRPARRAPRSDPDRLAVSRGRPSPTRSSRGRRRRAAAALRELGVRRATGWRCGAPKSPSDRRRCSTGSSGPARRTCRSIRSPARARGADRRGRRLPRSCARTRGAPRAAAETAPPSAPGLTETSNAPRSQRDLDRYEPDRSPRLRVGPRLHPLHVGLDRRAEGRDAHPPQRAGVRRVGGRAVRRRGRGPPLEPRAVPLRPVGLRPLRGGAGRAPRCTSWPPARRALGAPAWRRRSATSGSRSGTRCPRRSVLLCDAAAPADLASLRVVLFAGEVFPMKHLRRLRELLPEARSPTCTGRPRPTSAPTTRCASCPPADEPLPIGRACENQEVFALDESAGRCPRARWASSGSAGPP